MPNVGRTFMPGAQDEDEVRRRMASDPMGAALTLLSLRLPRVLGARALAPDILMGAPGMAGGGGSPLASAMAESVINDVMGRAPMGTMGGALQGAVPMAAPGSAPAAVPQATPLTTPTSLTQTVRAEAARPSAPAPVSPTGAYQTPGATAIPQPPRVVPGEVGDPVENIQRRMVEPPITSGRGLGAAPDPSENLAMILRELRHQLQGEPVTDVADLLGGRRRVPY